MDTHDAGRDAGTDDTSAGDTGAGPASDHAGADHQGRTGWLRPVGQVALGAALAGAGAGHLTFQRQEFQAQVPQWFPADPDLVVVASGVIELVLGGALLATWKQPRRAMVGAATAAFFVGVFPGNIAQYSDGVDAFGLDTDTKRFVRLLFQPLLVAAALGATDAVRTLRASRAARGNTGAG